MFNRKAAPMTDEEREHILWAKSQGCVCCYQLEPRRSTGQVVEFNHHLHAGRRKGPIDGTPECMWHHRAEPIDGWTKTQMLDRFGPSRKYQGGKYEFERRFGTDKDLLSTFAMMVRS